MSLIQLSDVTFGYENSYSTVFSHISLQFDSRWRLGLIGRNGKGKTTLLQLLMGKYDYQGTIDASVHFAYFPYAVPDTSAQAGVVAEQLSGHAPQWRIKKEISLLGMHEDVLERPFVLLSGGEQTKLLLACLFLQEHSFLLIDEPTNHLDSEARFILGEYLNTKSGFLLVSHDRAVLDRCTDYTLALEKNEIRLVRGNFSTWWAEKTKLDASEIAQDKKLKQEIGRLSAAAKQAGNWSDKLEQTKYGTRIAGLRPDRGHIGHKAAKMMKRAKGIEQRKNDAIAHKTALLRNIEAEETLKIHTLPYHGNELLSFHDVSLFYSGRCVCANIRFSVKNGERIALRGKNGCGKSTLLRLAAGSQIEYDGNFQKGSGLSVSYIPQDTSFLSGSLEHFLCIHSLDRTLFFTVLRKLDFAREQFDIKMEHYSAGQKKKVLLAKSLCEKANLFIWDEPLNYIDVFSRMQIETLLLSCRATLLFVEHDEAFVRKIATSVVDL